MPDASEAPPGPRFTVGYQPLNGEPDYFSDIVRDYRDAIAEVYFAAPGEPSGRSPVPVSAEAQTLEELAWIRSQGIRLHLLLNAACDGGHALSAAFADGVADRVCRWLDRTGLDGVTVFSPFLARMIRARFPGLELRASVNLRIGTVSALRQTAPFFDSYTIQRERNRDPERLAAFRKWAAAEGKSLVVLANSGCLNYCAFQSFHDNVIAHEDEIRRAPDSALLPTLCRSHFADPANRADFLRGSWIRPEDVRAHHRITGALYKLATRQHGRPRIVIGAYARGRFHGNLADLLEPGHGPAFEPCLFANGCFPPDWFERTLCGDRICETCRYCDGVLDQVCRRA